MTTDIGSTVDDLDNLVHLDRDLSDVWTRCWNSCLGRVCVRSVRGVGRCT